MRRAQAKTPSSRIASTAIHSRLVRSYPQPKHRRPCQARLCGQNLLKGKKDLCGHSDIGCYILWDTGHRVLPPRVLQPRIASKVFNAIQRHGSAHHSISTIAISAISDSSVSLSFRTRTPTCKHAQRLLTIVQPRGTTILVFLQVLDTVSLLQCSWCAHC